MSFSVVVVSMRAIPRTDRTKRMRMEMTKAEPSSERLRK